MAAIGDIFGEIASRARYLGSGLRSSTPVLETGSRLGGMLSEMHAGDRMLLGGAAGAGLSVAFGDQNKSIENRLETGALLGAGVGFFSSIAGSAAGALGESAYQGVRRGTGPALRNVGNYFKEHTATFNSLRKTEGLGSSAYKAFGTYGMFAATGAVVGGLRDSDNRLRGIGYGALGGLALKGGVDIVRMYNRSNIVVQTAMIAGLTASAYGIARAFQNPEIAGTAPTLSESMGIGSEVSDRARSMNARGDIVFGLHNGRH